MAEKKLDASGGMGDITSLMHNQGLADLSWLAVDEKEYRAYEALPKQNLDMIPELQKAVSMAEGVPHVVPLRPHTVVNRNPSDTLPVSAIDISAPIRNRVARLVMAGLPVEEIPKRLSLEFAHGDIILAKEAIQEVLRERGVLGNVYVDAKHFPRAASDPKERKLAQQLGKGAMYVLGGCGGTRGCSCSQTGFCSVFGGKQVVSEVPWGPKLAARFAPRLAAEKRQFDMSKVGSGKPVSALEWKEIVRAAFLRAPVAPVPDGVKTAHTQQPVPKVPVTKADVASFWARRRVSSTAEPMPSPAYMKYARRMMEGRDDTSLLIASGNPELASLASEYGLLGHSYVDMDALGGCRQALSVIRKSGSVTPDFAVRRSASCEHCKCAEDGACAQIAKTSFIVDRRPQFDMRSFARSLLRGVSRGAITVEQARVAAQNSKNLAAPAWTALTAKMNLFVPPKASAAPFSGIKMSAHNGAPARDTDLVPVNPDEVRMSISHLMNTGLTGRALAAAVLSRYSRRDLQGIPDVGRRLASEDGVQGVYFIDPTAYSDYGRGCEAGAKAFRKKEGSAPFVLVASGCTGCMLQTAPGWCSKYSKTLIRQVPTQVRKASADAKRQLPVLQPTVENPVEKYELSADMDVGPQEKLNLGPEIRIQGHSVGD
jgi:hypothetical protein